MDFGFGNGGNQTSQGGGTATGQQAAVVAQEGDTNNNGTQGGTEGNQEPEGGTEGNGGNGDEGNQGTKEITQQGTETEFAVEPGTQIEYDGNNYTVDENGNIVDANGNIFKEAKDVKAFIDSMQQDTSGTEGISSIKDIMDAIGVDILDENGRAIEFDNTSEGVAAYVNQVIENSKEDIQKEAISIFMSKYPFVGDIINYYVANGNSLEGYNEVPDRSGITVEENNVEQQESIIRTAWREQGRKGDVSSYIEYLKSNGTLFSVAKEELEGLQANDKAIRDRREQEAQRMEEEEKQNTIAYWNKVQGIIKDRKIGNYELPNTIIRNIDGKKVAGSLDDFFNYLYRIDKDGKSAYVHDLEKQNADDTLRDEVLRAYLTYTGGSYESLVGMAINAQEVKRLRLTAKTNTAKGIKVTPPTQTDQKKINFGL